MQSEPPADRSICVALAGGLGNQMFQFAAGYALARRTGGSLRFDLAQYEKPNDRDTKRNVLLSCFGISVPTCTKPADHGAGRLARAWKRIGRELTGSRSTRRGGTTVYRQPGYHFDEGFLALSPPVHLTGFFQSELYFASVADELRDLFRIRAPQGANFARQLAEIEACDFAVSIHARRGDYVADAITRDYHGVLDERYYGRAVALARRLCDGPARYFVFSDEPAAKPLDGLVDATYVTGNQERPWEDLALMSACRGHVLANSSFSWWGAWLDQKPGKWVIAPRNWFSAKTQRTLSTSDLACPDWITI